MEMSASKNIAILNRPLRPSERVREFILSQKLQSASEDSRLPSIRQVAAHLGVSIATVQTVFRKLRQEGYLSIQPNRGSYLAANAPLKKDALRMGIDFIRGDENPLSSWRAAVYGGILEGILASSRTIILEPYPFGNQGLDLVRTAVAENRLDGMIFGPPVRDPILDLCRELKLPMASPYPSDLLSTTNFVAADNYTSAFQVGKAFKASGRERVVFLQEFPFNGDPDLVHFYSGLLAGYADSGTGHQRWASLWHEPDTTPAIAPGFAPRNFHINSLAEVVRGCEILFADRKTAPDAVFCISDHTALTCLDWLRRNNFQVPQEVSIVAGSGLPYSHPDTRGMTTITQPVHQIGKALVALVTQLIENLSVHVPGYYLPCRILGGSTTLPQENALLGLAE